VDGSGAALVPTTAMAAASITKTFVAAEVLRLAEAGRVDLDAPLSTYVRHDLTANGATVRQHLAMRAGAPDFIPVDYASIDRAFSAAPSRHWTVGEALDYVSGPLGHPGQPYSYSNPSFMLLGMLVEKVTGHPLAVALRRDLVDPAGLARFALQDVERPALPIARSPSGFCGELFDGFIPCRSLASALGGAGAVAADAPTVARWGYQLYGARVVSLEVVDQMTAGDGEYGLGTVRFSGRLGLGEGFGHRGGAPGYSSLLVVVPEYRTSVAIMLADGDKNVDTVAVRLMNAIQKLR
ncbi:MAG: serine hydrolase domain-containing protein, partial [Nocardioidaceae bacterium]